MNAIVPITPSEFEIAVSMARTLTASGLLPSTVSSPEKAVAIILAGRELGIAPWQALSTINVISGKPTISPQLMLALIERSGQLEQIAVTDDGTTCTVVLRRRGRAAHTETFSMTDASAMGLALKDNWKKQPKIMRRWRAVAAAARIVFPDVILGLYTPEEMGADVAVSDDGEMSIITPPAAAPAPTPAATITITAEPAPVAAFTQADAAVLEKWAAEKYSLYRPDIHRALGVSRYGLYTGTLAEAKAAVVAWLDAQFEGAVDAPAVEEAPAPAPVEAAPVSAAR